MALLYDSRLRAIDANGDPLVGATLTINTANTAVPAAVFSDVGLTVPLSNPTTGVDKSDAGGWFPQIFAAEATTVDIILKNGAGVTVQTYVDVIFVGAGGGTFERTFTNLSRFKLSDTAGIVLMEHGDASPDNTGGTMTVQGWAGTQGDAITFNHAAVNAGTSAGALKENSKKLPGVIDATGTGSGTAGTVIALPNTPTGVRMWDIYLWDIVAAGTGHLTGVLSFDNGANYKTGASDYSWVAGRQDGGNAGPSWGQFGTIDEADAAMRLIYNLVSTTNLPGYAHITVITPNSGAPSTIVTCHSETTDVSTSPFLSMGRATGRYVGASAGRATHLKVAQGGSALTFSYMVIPRRGTGDA